MTNVATTGTTNKSSLMAKCNKFLSVQMTSEPARSLRGAAQRLPRWVASGYKSRPERPSRWDVPKFH